MSRRRVRDRRFTGQRPPRNGFIHAAADYTNRSRDLDGQFAPCGILTEVIRVRYDSGSTQERYAGLGGDDIAIAANPNSHDVRQRLTLAGIAPVENGLRVRFVSSAEPLAAGNLGQAVLAARPTVRADVADESEAPCAGVTECSPTSLTATPRRSVSILRRPGSRGFPWALIGHGRPTPRSVVSLELMPVSGTQGPRPTRRHGPTTIWAWSPRHAGEWRGPVRVASTWKRPCLG